MNPRLLSLVSSRRSLASLCVAAGSLLLLNSSFAIRAPSREELRNFDARKQTIENTVSNIASPRTDSEKAAARLLIQLPSARISIDPIVGLTKVH